MKKITIVITIFLSALLIISGVAGAFYWFSIRPGEIVKKCTSEKGHYLEAAKAEYLKTGVLPAGMRNPFPSPPASSSTTERWQYANSLGDYESRWNTYVVPNAGEWLESKYKDCLRSKGLR